MGWVDRVPDLADVEHREMSVFARGAKMKTYQRS